MDILAARKKAAERAQAEKKKEELSAANVEQQPVPELPERAAADAAVPPHPMPAEPAVPVDRALEAPMAAAPAAVPETAGDERSGEPVSSPADSEAASSEGPVADTEMLGFLLSGEEYVVPVGQVNEVLKMWSLTPVPNAPEHILGVSSLRGTMLTIIDLGKRLGLGPATMDEKSRVVVVTVDDEKVGFIVDRVTGVVKLAPDLVRAVPETVEHGVEFLRGIARKDDRLFILLDLDKAAGS
jgi:purine-binding chemotaxis protein CheW